MSFSVPSKDYDRYTGRYSLPLAPLLAGFAGVEPGQRVLDVGCGPGALTVELAGRVGADRVAAADRSAGFARACADRVPAADVREAPAEAVPWPAGTFDVVVAQLVVSFLDAPNVWDAARALEAEAPDEARARCIDPDSHAALWAGAGLRGIEAAPLVVEVEYADFERFLGAFPHRHGTRRRVLHVAGSRPPDGAQEGTSPATRDTTRLLRPHRPRLGGSGPRVIAGARRFRSAGRVPRRG